MKAITRREFLCSITLLGLGAILASCTPKVASTPTSKPQVTNNPTPTAKEPTPVAQVQAPTAVPATKAPEATVTPQPPTAAPTKVQAATAVPAAAAYLAVARGSSPTAITQRAVAAIGGIERFVKRGYEVIIKPNICNASNGPEYASTTNPEVVAALIKMCLGAGAKRVRVMDYPFSGSPQAAYVRSGIEEAVKAAGGEMEVMASMRFTDTKIPDGKDIKSWKIYKPILEADLVINLPIAKHHSLTRLTLGGKNLLGMVENRGSLHYNIGQRIADLNSLIKPQLTIIDAVRILMANGPTGGDLSDVKKTDTIIASHDMVAADTYATGLFGVKPSDIAYIPASAKMGLGTMDLTSVKVEELNV
jgi:uncharacterized protein (DUF362 family)